MATEPEPGRRVRRRLAEAVPILLVGTGLFVAGSVATGGFHWLKWPLELVGGTLIVVGVLWVPVTVGLPLLRKPLAGMIVSQLNTDWIVAELATRIRPAIAEAAVASVPPLEINSARVAHEIAKELNPVVAEAIASAVPEWPSPEQFAALVVAGIEKRIALPTPDRELQARRRVIAHKVATELEGQRLKLDAALSEFNPYAQGEWANMESRDLLRAEPKYALAVRLVDRAFQALALVDPNTMTFIQQDKIARADEQVDAAVEELDHARDADQ